ncbi:tRNA (adenosine(37)-N6)-dimethylallyltransferase MiaA [Candidatus Kaiserbacteria bacterium RIFOXYB1_FULL_46_14]|uniref:tRNA dimethylallyltransferase n=1 Tax=Candidatus Kaiserbacteria bacterium RIFOXYB1_FULL_46_14 TaxID=1798531 RepID=A0A1F6FIN5_9BACT|nr:MAG: tRNA (adenosine(37)-N6)-dimethylallyltransferase MiaA [Candidatus Kaiserbacteria bacterium RIFOXYB1_FULL_46_14]
MLEELKKPKIVVVVGPTASGKTGMAVELAKRFNGEVVSADSRQVYRGMDIGTAKVTTEEMQGIPHHLLDVASPTEVYTASDFARDAKIVINDIISRGRLPIVAGGTFFYIDTLLGKVTVPEVPPDQVLRATLEEKSAADLLSILESLDPDRAASIEPENQRRLVRAIEIATYLGKVPPQSPSDCPYDVLTIGLLINIETHGEIVKQRIIERLNTGMADEVRTLLESGVTHERLESFGLEYRYLSRYLRGLLDYDSMVEELSVKTRQFAKRQMTWLKRDKTIQWFLKDDPEIFDVMKRFLTN